MEVARYRGKAGHKGSNFHGNRHHRWEKFHHQGGYNDGRYNDGRYSDGRQLIVGLVLFFVPLTIAFVICCRCGLHYYRSKQREQRKRQSLAYGDESPRPYRYQERPSVPTMDSQIINQPYSPGMDSYQPYPYIICPPSPTSGHQYTYQVHPLAANPQNQIYPPTAGPQISYQAPWLVTGYPPARETPV